ncbi:MAG: START domain-containing protein [Smithella sp.]
MSKRNVIITLVLMLLIVATTGFAADKYQWKLVDTEGSCQIYTSTVASKEFIAAKATCLIPAKMEVISTILRDIESLPEWLHDCKEAKTLKVVDPENDVIIFWIHQHITLFTDRDMVLKSRTELDLPKGLNFIYVDSTNDIPYDTGKGYVRMPSNHSEYILEWIDRDHTKVTFINDPDLGKGIPAGLANPKIQELPYKSLKNMMKMVQNQKYIEAAKTNKYHKMAEDFMKAGHN